MHYLTGLDRKQSQIFTRLEDLVGSRHYARLIDLIGEKFFSENASAFGEKGEQNIGRKAYSPACLLKLYIYGYLNGISSSRKLERECARNLELMWLMNQLVPDHKTIADFRKDNGEAIKQSVLAFGKWLQQSGHIKGDVVSIDGSRIRANASRSFDLDHVSKKLEQLETQLQEYIAKASCTDQLDEATEQAEKEKEKLHQHVKDLQQQINELELKKAFLDQEQAKRISPTDPQARIMKSRQGKHFCYNVQVVVDEQNKLILCNQVYNHENDKGLLKPMVEQTEKVLNQSPKEVLADAGYHQLNQLEELEKRGIECYVAINENKEQAKEDEHGIKFEFDEKENIYRCSQGQSLAPIFGMKHDRRRGTEAQAYKGTNCQPCPIKKLCTTSTSRSVYRFTNQQWRDHYRSKLKSKIGISKLKLRKCLSEHPFGTIKCWMGHVPILLRGKEKVQTEINIYAIAYNFKRMLTITSFEDLEKLFRPVPS